MITDFVSGISTARIAAAAIPYGGIHDESYIRTEEIILYLAILVALVILVHRRRRGVSPVMTIFLGGLLPLAALLITAVGIEFTDGQRTGFPNYGLFVALFKSAPSIFGLGLAPGVFVALMIEPMKRE